MCAWGAVQSSASHHCIQDPCLMSQSASGTKLIPLFIFYHVTAPGKERLQGINSHNSYPCHRDCIIPDSKLKRLFFSSSVSHSRTNVTPTKSSLQWQCLHFICIAMKLWASSAEACDLIFFLYLQVVSGNIPLDAMLNSWLQGSLGSVRFPVI